MNMVIKMTYIKTRTHQAAKFPSILAWMSYHQPC